MAELIHGTAIAVAGRAVLIRGPSGAGKSDLALRCLAVPAGPFAAAAPMLVADDQVLAQLSGAAVLLSPPDAIAGLIEVRGIGIVTMPFVRQARLALVADLAEPTAIERLPATGSTVLVCGAVLPRIAIAPLEASAPLKLLLALAATANQV